MVSLEHAALLHHSPAEVLAEGPELPEEVRAALAAVQDGRVPRDGPQRMLAGIVMLANAVDEQMESILWDARPVSELWEELESFRGMAGKAVWEAACSTLRHPYLVATDRRWELPVHGPVVREVVKSLRTQRECDVAVLAKLAGRDPVLSGNVLAAANSAWFGRRTPCRNVKQALAYIGPEAGRRILLALALKPLYGSARLAELWRHAVEAAGFCEALAAATGFLPASDAMVLGLVHDIGRVALLRQPAAANRARTRLEERGAPAVYAEQMLFGAGHGPIGAGILERWEFAPDMVEAVRFHHEPGDSESAAAAALYMAEFWSESDEDLPSARHLDAAQRRLGCSIEMLSRVSREKTPMADWLRVA